MESIERLLHRESHEFEDVQSCEESLDEVEGPLSFLFDLFDSSTTSNNFRFSKRERQKCDPDPSHIGR